MPTDEVLEVVYGAIDQINRENPDSQPVTKSMTTSLYGSGSDLDSLGLINLVVAIERNIEQRFGVPITLVDDRALSQEESPFANVASLVSYIKMLLKEEKDV